MKGIGVNRTGFSFRNFGLTEKLILINVAVYLLFMMLAVFAFLFRRASFVEVIRDTLILPSDVRQLLYKPWTVVTYAFLHAGFWHLFGNMIMLYFSGRFFLTYFSPRRMLNYYFLGTLAGALFFVLSYNIFPVFQDEADYKLLGASAAVMAVLVGVATYSPNFQIRFFFIGGIKLWWIAAFFVAKDILYIPIENPGGHIAHLGGSALGFIYSRQLLKGKDIGGWFGNLMDGMVGLFSKRTQQPFKKVYKNKTRPAAGKPADRPGPRAQEQKDKQKKIDAILDKISKNGYDSLSKEEKEFLFSISKD